VELNSRRSLLSVAAINPKYWLALLQDGKTISEKGHFLKGKFMAF
jgi:hypothetical protein